MFHSCVYVDVVTRQLVVTFPSRQQQIVAAQDWRRILARRIGQILLGVDESADRLPAVGPVIAIQVPEIDVRELPFCVPGPNQLKRAGSAEVPGCFHQRPAAGDVPINFRRWLRRTRVVRANDDEGPAVIELHTVLTATLMPDGRDHLPRAADLAPLLIGRQAACLPEDPEALPSRRSRSPRESPGRETR